MIQSRSKVCADIPGVQYRQRLAKMIQDTIDRVLFKLDFKRIVQLPPAAFN